MLGRDKKPAIREGAYVFGTRDDGGGGMQNFFFGVVTGVEGRRIGVSGTLVNPAGLKNKVSQNKAGPRSVEILQNPTPDNCVLALVYRTEHENFVEEIDLDGEQVLLIPPRVYSVLDGWIRESIPEIIGGVLSLPAGDEQEKARHVMRQRMDTIADKNLRRTMYSVCRSLRILT